VRLVNDHKVKKSNAQLLHRLLWYGIAFSLFVCRCDAMSLKSEKVTDEKAADEADSFIALAMKPWTGDLDGMIERRMIRVLTTYSKTRYFLDGATQRGATYEWCKQFEKVLNQKLKLGGGKVHVVIIPLSKDRLLPGLLEGIGDIAASNLTITPERAKLVDFSTPWGGGVQEVLVTGPDVPHIETLDDLAGREVVVRKSSSYYESLTNVNQKRKKGGKVEIGITIADEDLEEEDILEMINAGIYPLTVVDHYIAQFWKQIFPAIVVREDIVFRSGGEIAAAFRKNSPNLEKALNDFICEHKIGTEFGNIVFKRYFRSTAQIKKSLNTDELAKFNQAASLIKKYAGMYNFDWLMIPNSSIKLPSVIISFDINF